MTDTNFSKIVKWILLSPLILICIGVAICEINKAYWDHQVKVMCEKDGGVTVFEKVELTLEEYQKNNGANGIIRVPSENLFNAKKHVFLSKRTETEINHSNPEVWRTESIFYKNEDKKILSKMVTYSRRGGDFPTGLIHPSHFGCGDIKNINLDIEKQTFSFKGE